MDDRELVQELRTHARSFEELDGVNRFLTQEYEMLVRAADRLDYLSAQLRLSAKSGHEGAGFSNPAPSPAPKIC